MRAAGLKSCLREELERMHPASFAWALWCCGRRREEAEEVLQSAYLKVFEGSARFNGDSSLRTWFFSVIRRTATEQRRRRSLRQQLLERWFVAPPEASWAPDPEAFAASSETSRALLQALAALSSRQREVLHLVFYQDMTIEEASRILNISLGTARTHFARGKQQLRQLLAVTDDRKEKRA
jgi:RNA polymerase sigma-70 factor (ECF subfamily)